MRLPDKSNKKIEDRTGYNETDKFLNHLFSLLNPSAALWKMRQVGLEKGWIEPEVNDIFGRKKRR